MAEVEQIPKDGERLACKGGPKDGDTMPCNWLFPYKYSPPAIMTIGDCKTGEYVRVGRVWIWEPHE